MADDPKKYANAEPKFLDEDVAVERIKDLITTARATWLVLLGFLAFIGLTLLSIRDVDFFSISATIDLPIVGIAIPTKTFLWTASVLAAILHTYFHVHLIKFWDALAEAPPSIGHLKLGDRIFPWLVNDWALRRRPDQPVTPRPLDWLADIVTTAVIWAATPFVLFFFWWWSMPAHNGALTLAIAIAFFVSSLASTVGRRRARLRLGHPGLIHDAKRNLPPLPRVWYQLGYAAGILPIGLSLLRTEIGTVQIGPMKPSPPKRAGYLGWAFPLRRKRRGMHPKRFKTTIRDLGWICP